MKFLNEEETKFKEISAYLSLKGPINREPYSILWRNKYSGRPSVGSCMWLCKELRPTSYQDFFNKYVESGNKDAWKDERGKKSYKRGRTLEELEEIAINWRNDCGNPPEMGLNTFFDAVVLHVIIETFMGKEKEFEARRMLEECGFVTEDATDNEDTEMNIDFKVYKDGELKYLMQVKPVSFITSNNNDTRDDRMEAFRKHECGHKKYPNIPYYYLVYDASNGLWIINKEKGRCLFEYGELVNPFGRPVKTKNELIKNETDKLFKKN